jgi:hypothetical protein
MSDGRAGEVVNCAMSSRAAACDVGPPSRTLSRNESSAFAAPLPPLSSLLGTSLYHQLVFIQTCIDHVPLVERSVIIRPSWTFSVLVLSTGLFQEQQMGNCAV